MERTEIREDLEDLYNWDRIESTFDTVDGIETLTQRITLNDDGTSKEEGFSASERSVLYRDNPEGSGVRPWDSIEIRLNASLQRESRTILFDDGTFRGESYLNGIISNVFQSDGNGDNDGVEPWSQIETGFDENGQIEFRNSFYDDGTFRGEGYLNGIISNIFQSDGNGDNDDVEPWSQIETRFDENGQIVSRGTIYDDGTLREETYEDGVLRTVVQRDNPSESHNGAEPWSIIETRFDQEGRLVNRATVNDDGTQREETYLNGTIRTIVQNDNPAESHDGAEPWSIIETLYDETGQRTSKTVINDDGSQKIETFQNGIRTRVEVAEERPGTFGGPFLELMFAADYDADTGTLTDRYKMNADGTSRTETFENGNRVSLTLTDSRNDLNLWQTIQTAYADGAIADRTTIYDNGDRRLETFSDNRLASILDSDAAFLEVPPSVCTFSPSCPESPIALRNGIDQRETVFGDDGAITQRRTEYTDGDTTAALYENGRITQQHLVDGDNDQAWIARKILYDADGSVSDTIEFYDFEDIPTDFTLSLLMEDDTVVPIGIGSGGVTTLDNLPIFDGDLFLFGAEQINVITLATTGGTITVVAPGTFSDGVVTIPAVPDLDEPPSVDTFTPGGGISVTAGSGITISPVEIDMTPPGVEDFANGGVALNPGSGLTLTGGGSSPTPSATTFESMDAGPYILDLM